MLSPPDGLTDDDFDQVEAAVLETERGRWFLQEYARRLRATGIAEILAAIDRLSMRETERLDEQYEARRNAAETAIAMAEALQKLSAFALGAVAQQSRTRLDPQNPTPPPVAPRLPPSGELDRRLSALKELDALDVEAKVKLFG